MLMVVMFICRLKVVVLRVLVGRLVKVICSCRLLLLMLLV